WKVAARDTDLFVVDVEPVVAEEIAATAGDVDEHDRRAEELLSGRPHVARHLIGPHRPHEVRQRHGGNETVEGRRGSIPEPELSPPQIDADHPLVDSN